MWDTENQKACLAQDVTVYDVSGWGALWRSECRQKELTSKSDPMCFLVVPESGENWVWIFYPQPHSSTYHFGQLSGQHIEGERWHYWIGAAYKELLCLCETCLSALPYFRGKIQSCWEEPFHRLGGWQFCKPRAGPLQVFGKHSPASGASKGVLLESVVSSVCTLYCGLTRR